MATPFQALRPGARAYILLVILAGVAVISHSVYQLVVNPIGYQWVILAGLTLLTGSFNVKVSSINAHISVSEAFVFASILLFGTPAGTATVLLECMVILLWMKRENRLPYRVVFNMAAPSVAVWVAGTAFYFLSGIQPYSKQFTPLPQLFLPLLAFTALFFLVNSWLVAFAVGLENRVPPARIWWKNFAWLSVNYFSGASLAALIVTYTKQLDLSTLAVMVPLLVVSYLTFRTAMGRAEDSYSHLAELNRLYLSTIETLAMAIDAKDQITHGHIRRVQTYAVGLAKRIGVSDERLLKAIEAAALLHDMGKLAVPEYILNKPGKLTAAEFEKMKLHASVGADILSAIDFPYPVVPIVRHHHENWDGTGYPTGLRGTDIPIGARILSVVDCFDALTSDRPYRPRLSDEAAIEILLNRRGSMYDPLVVDTFIRVHREIAPEQADKIAVNALEEITHAGARELREPQSRQSPDRDAMAGQHFEDSSIRTLGEITSFLGDKLRSLVPFETAILYRYEIAEDALISNVVFSDESLVLPQLKFALGEHLSGWVAANRQTIVNSDPALDLGEVGLPCLRSLKTSISVPLVHDKELVGVITLYSSGPSYRDEQRQIVEEAAAVLASALKGNAPGASTGSIDRITGLQEALSMPDVLGYIGDRLVKGHITLLVLDVVALDEINTRFGRQAGDSALRIVAQSLQECLRSGDALLRHREDEFVAVLYDTDAFASTKLAKRMRESVKSRPLKNFGGEVIHLQISSHALALDALGSTTQHSDMKQEASDGPRPSIRVH